MGEGSRDANARALSDDVQCFLRSAGGIGAAHSGSLGSMPPSPSLEGISPGSLQSAPQHVLRSHQMRIRCASDAHQMRHNGSGRAGHLRLEAPCRAAPEPHQVCLQRRPSRLDLLACRLILVTDLLPSATSALLTAGHSAHASPALSQSGHRLLTSPQASPRPPFSPHTSSPPHYRCWRRKTSVIASR